jgi:ATP-dependent DNA helicase RecQ
VGSLAQRIAEVGRLDDLGDLPNVGGPDAGVGAETNSARRLAAVWEAFTVPPSTADAVAGLGGPVLLVDDLVDSGWTMTVAARALRHAGAPAVLPFALAVAA